MHSFHGALQLNVGNSERAFLSRRTVSTHPHTAPAPSSDWGVEEQPVGSGSGFRPGILEAVQRGTEHVARGTLPLSG